MDTKVAVSIIVPCYNAATYLPKCLDSILAQSYSDFEVICVDDASTDSTKDILTEYAGHDRRFHIIRQSKNRGVSTARNRGLNAADGEFILFCDPDDYYEPDALRTFIRFAKQTEADIICSELNVIYFAHQEMESSDLNYYRLKQTGLNNISPEIIRSLDLSTNNKLFRRSLIERNGLRFPAGLRFEDAYFSVAYLCLCKKAYFLRQHLYNYVRHANSEMSNTWSNVPSENHAIDHLHIAFKLYDFLGQKHLLPQYEQLFWELLYQFSWFTLNNIHSISQRMQAKHILETFIQQHPDEFNRQDTILKKNLKKLTSKLRFFSLTHLKLSLLKLPAIRSLHLKHLSTHPSGSIDKK